MSYDELFEKYLENIGKAEGDLILPLLKKSNASTNSRIEISIPENWANNFTVSVKNNSIMYQELKSRAYDSAYPSKPHLNIIDRGSPHVLKVINWTMDDMITMEEMNASRSSDRSSEDEYTVNSLTTYSTSTDLIPKPLEVCYHIAEYIDVAENIKSIIEKMSYDVACFIDRSVILPDHHMINSPIEGMLTANNVFDHESGGFKSIAGYIDNTDVDLKTFDPQTIKNTLFHLPPGYRQRAKWIMNTNTALALEEMHLQANDFLNVENNWSPLSNKRLLNKPVIINEYMPDKGLIIILADLTRGYQISNTFEDMDLIITPRTIGVRFNIAGKVLQPAAFKGVRCNYTYEIPEINYDLVELKPDYDEDGNEVLY